ncbi:hypothetical protein O0L34_g8733 [Tuta absoluta]|nr:hypothetical protein O0L34_g8733 [Tuta absoluta]
MADDITVEDDVKEQPSKIGEQHDSEEDEEEVYESLGEGDGEFDEEEEEDKKESSEGEEQVDEEDISTKDIAFIEEAWGEMPDEGEEGEVGEIEVEGEDEKKIDEEELVEEGIEEEEEVDPNAPYNLSDESEAKKAPFSLDEEQMTEIQEIWDSFQAYTPAYTDIDQYVTPKELVYMLKALNLHTHTPEQMMELIEFCVRPPHPDNHVNFEQFLWIVTIRQRDMPIEEEVRLALITFDPGNTGIIDREYLREILRDHGKKMKTVDLFIREVDMSNDGLLGLEDIVGTICIDLNRDDIEQLLLKIYPPGEGPEDNIEALTT